MFVLSFKNDNDHPMRDSSDDYCMPFLEIEDFNALIDNKPVFDHLVRNKQSAYERTVKMFRNNDCAPGNLLGFSNHQNIIYLLAQIYQGKKIRVFLKKPILQKK